MKSSGKEERLLLCQNPVAAEGMAPTQAAGGGQTTNGDVEKRRGFDCRRPRELIRRVPFADAAVPSRSFFRQPEVAPFLCTQSSRYLLQCSVEQRLIVILINPHLVNPARSSRQNP